MNEEKNNLEDDHAINPAMRVVAPVPSLSRPVLSASATPFDIGLSLPMSSSTDPIERECTIMQQPANINIVITPCDNTIENPYEHSSLSGKIHKPRSRRWGKKRGHCMSANWLSSHANERRLRSAAASKDIGEVRKLIEKDLDLNLDAADDKQRTALHLSVANGCQKIVKLLLENGAQPNVKDIKGNSPLHLAACCGKVPLITLLLSHGANMSAVDFNGKTPLHLALARLKLLKKDPERAFDCNVLKVKSDVKEIAELLREYLAREGTNQEQSEINILNDKLQSVASNQELDEVGDLLFNFTQMAISIADSNNRSSSHA